jgi:hypothetical protein
VYDLHTEFPTDSDNRVLTNLFLVALVPKVKSHLQVKLES